MAKEFSSLSIYRLNDTFGGRHVAKLDDFIDPKKKTSSHTLRGRYNFRAQLFIAPPDEKQPRWLEPLKVGFGDLDEIPDSVRSNAVLIISVKSGRQELFFAATFGFGRFLLRQGSFERNYGLRVALNAIYPKHVQGQKLAPERLRSVDSKTVAETTLRTRRQVDRKADFESFNVDIERDLLDGVTGTPLDLKLWGSRIDGSDATHINRAVAFEQLGDLCLQIEKHSKRVPREFGWIDNIFLVRESTLIEALRTRVLEMVRTDKVEDLDLAPPELVEWGNIDHFEFSFAPDEPFADPSIDAYIGALQKRDRLTSLTLSQLTLSHRLIAFDAEGQEIDSWTVFRSLSGELEHHSPTYILSEGDFYEVKGDYMNELDAALDKVAEFTSNLPDSKPKWSEDLYNKEAAGLPGNFLLDKKTVKLTRRTSAIEVCDVLSSGRELIHVKRKLNSSSLSHLFAQGLISADLLLMNEEFRKKVRQRIAELEKERHVGDRFSKLFPMNRGITASAFTVVYAIIADWKGKTLAQRLPFFSKVNLRRTVQDLTRMGYGVAHKCISIS